MISNRLALITLLCLGFVAFIGKAYETSLRGIDSNIHASVSMDMTSQGFLPKLPAQVTRYALPPTQQPADGSSKVVFNDHPFFLFWVNGWVMRLLGPSAWSARILTATFSVGCVFLTYLLGATLLSRLFGMIAALILIFTRDFILTSGTNSLDTAMLFFLLLSFYFWLRKRWISMALAAGVGLWIKTPVVLLVFPVALIISIVKKNWKLTLPQLISSGVLAVAVGSLVWIATGKLAGWEWVRDYWVRQVWGTAVGGRDAGLQQGWSLFVYTIKTGFLPGLPLLVLAFFQIIRKRRWNEPAFLVPLTATLVLVLAVTSMRFQLGHYFTPMFPFLALISAYSVAEFLKSREQKFYNAIIGFSLLVFTYLLCTPTPLAPESFVALRRFVPIIQTASTCGEKIYLIPGGEPVGSAHDYSLLLDHYTGRPIEIIECAKLSQVKEGWMILSHENKSACLSQEQQKRFATQIRVGQQYLLTHHPLNQSVIDLTPLERGFFPVTDCKAPPYPSDRYHRYLDGAQ